jgi:hypothetical protein
MRYIAFLAALIAALTLSPTAAAATDWAWPVRGDVVTPYKNGDDPYASGQHRGIDIAAPVGARVAAATGGQVTYVGVAGSSGLTVGVRTDDGRFDVSYLHLSAAAVREGDSVARGAPIGAVGTSGHRSVDRPHLHFGVREARDRHAYRDPLDFLPPLASPVVEPPSAVPVTSPDPVTAPPAGAPVLARAPEGAAAPAPGAPPVWAAVAGLAAPGGVQQALPAEAGTATPGHAAAAPAGATPVASGERRTVPGSGPATAQVPGADRVAAPARAGAQVTRADLSQPVRSPVADRPATRPEHGRSDGGLSTPTAGPDGGAPEARVALPHRPRVTPHRETGGLNLGWLAAVVGLVAAATCLGRPRATRRVARTGRGALGAVLRPLAGRG